MTGFSKSGLLAGALTVFAFGLPPAHAQQAAPDPSADGRPADEARRVDHDTVKTAGEDDIAKELDNLIGNLTILPFENYTNFQVGSNKGTQNILEFEPVVPIHLNADWNLINRAIIPVVWNPDLSPFPSVPQAFAPIDYSAFFSPRNPVNGWTVGAGPDRPAPDRHQPDCRLQRLGRRPDRGCRPYLRAYRRRRAGQPGLVARRRAKSGPGGKRYARARWSRSSTTISATAGSSAPRRSSPTSKITLDGNGRCRSARWRAGLSSSAANCQSNCRSAATTTS